MHIRLPLCTLTKLHYSQTTTIVQWQWFVLYTHTNLHYSQTIISSTLSLVCFAPLQNYTTLKLALIVPTLKSRFVPLQNYTTLKHYPDHNLLESGFVPLQNYTTLKQRENFPATLLCFVPLQNYTTLKLSCFSPAEKNQLCTPTKLHYSQTGVLLDRITDLLCTPTKLHYSQTSNI